MLAKMKIEVLRSYRNLYRTCQRVFNGDPVAINAARARIREEFLKNSQVSDKDKLSKLVEDAREAEQFLREHVVQAVQTGENTFRLKITEDTKLEDSPYKPPQNPTPDKK